MLNIITFLFLHVNPDANLMEEDHSDYIQLRKNLRAMLLIRITVGMTSTCTLKLLFGFNSEFTILQSNSYSTLVMNRCEKQAQKGHTS